ncbi:MAG TPA: zinc-finger domain-containing protein [Gammaproteobacteria bacterium]
MRQRSGTIRENLDPPNAAKIYKVTRADLPLHCPLPGTYLWSSHPKVYLAIEATGRAKCPYCSASYELVDDQRRR